MEEYLIKSPDEMLDFGAQFAKELSGGTVVALIGDLGAGKTHFSKGVCRELGYDETSSPTFSLVNEHDGGRLEVFHFDFYRIKKVEELWSLDWEEYLERGGVVLVEWANLFPEVFPEETVWIKILHEGAHRRVMIKKPLLQI